MARPSVQPAPVWDISLQQLQLPYLIYRYWVHGSELYVLTSSYLEYGGCVPAAFLDIPEPAVRTLHRCWAGADRKAGSDVLPLDIVGSSTGNLPNSAQIAPSGAKNGPRTARLQSVPAALRSSGYPRSPAVVVGTAGTRR